MLMNKLQGIDRRLEEGDKKFHEFHLTLQENTKELAEHVKGSIATNKRLEIVENKMPNIEKHVSFMQKFGKIIGPSKRKIAGVLAAISLFFGIVKVIDYLKMKNIL